MSAPDLDKNLGHELNREADNCGAVLLADLADALNPVGSLELTLIVRIAVTMWRQRRLVQAETASLKLARTPVNVGKDVSAELRRGYANEIKPDELEDFHSDREPPGAVVSWPSDQCQGAAHFCSTSARCQG